MTVIHEGHDHEWVDGLCDDNGCEAWLEKVEAAIRAINPGGPKHKIDHPESSFDPLLRESEVIAVLRGRAGVINR